jgi:glycosyltransferase involved in cell wall biosynthesis
VTAVGIVVPARDEEERIGACLRSVHAAVARAGVRAVVCVVADRCTDRTAECAAGLADVLRAAEPRTIGEVRNVGARHVLRHGVTWLLGTDADSVVPETWVRDHLRYAAAGADAVAGPVDLDDPETLPREVLARYLQVLREGTGHAYAANLGVRASAFRAVGGYPAVPHGEEHAILARLRAGGFTVVSPSEVRVRTSARTRGRAASGLADLLDGLGA